MANIELDTERKVGNADLANLIRFPDTEAARMEAEKLARQSREDMEVARRMDAIKLRIESGGTLSTDEQNFLDQQEGKLNAPTVEEKAALERAAADKAAAEAAKKEGEGSGASRVAELDAIIAKVEKGETLTAEEEKLALEAEQRPALPDKTYKVGGKELKFEEAASQMWKDYGLEAPQDLPVEALTKMVDTFVTKLNKDSWSAAATQRDQTLAKNRRQVSTALLNILNTSDGLKKDMERVERLKAEMEQIAQKPVDKTAIYDSENRVDVDKQREYSKVMDAREALPRLQNEITDLKERSLQTERQLVAQRFRDFQEANPEYATSQDVTTLAAQMGAGTLSVEDETKVGEMIRIFREADATRQNPQTEHDYRLRLGMLAVKPDAGGAGGGGSDPSKFRKDQETDRQKLLDNLKRKRDAARSITGGGAPAERQVKLSEKQKHAWNIAGASRAQVAGSAGKSIADKMTESGY